LGGSEAEEGGESNGKKSERWMGVSMREQGEASKEGRKPGE